jgi:hypothetical protein
MKQKKRFTPAERAKMFQPTFIFGYGSLLLAHGVNGRGMAKNYKDKDLIPCELSGYTRSMCAFFGGRNFYGLLENKSAVCNGVVFQVHDWYDYRAFLYSEGATAGYKAHRTYWPINVTEKITGLKVAKNQRVITLLCKEDKSNFGRAEKRYISLCHQGAKIWGPKFEEKFLATGGIPYDRTQMKKIAKENNLKLW